MRFTSR